MNSRSYYTIIGCIVETSSATVTGSFGITTGGAETISDPSGNAAARRRNQKRLSNRLVLGVVRPIGHRFSGRICISLKTLGFLLAERAFGTSDQLKSNCFK